MTYQNFFKDLFESITDYRKIVFLIFLIKKDKGLLLEIGSSERDINRLKKDFKSKLIELHEDYLGYVKNQEESIIENILNKYINMHLSL